MALRCRDTHACTRTPIRAVQQRGPFRTLRMQYVSASIDVYAHAQVSGTEDSLRFTLPQAQVSVAVERANERICGYILAYLDAKAMTVLEAGVLGGHNQALDALAAL